MSKKSAIIGKTFGTLTATEKVSPAPYYPGTFKWRCSCDGRIVIRLAHTVMAMAAKGRTPSCGCAHGVPGYRPEDHSGKKLGRLTAIRQEPPGQSKIWLMQCDCGNEVTRNIKDTRDAVADGHSPSCPACRYTRKTPAPQAPRPPISREDLF